MHVHVHVHVQARAGAQPALSPALVNGSAPSGSLDAERDVYGGVAAGAPGARAEAGHLHGWLTKQHGSDPTRYPRTHTRARTS